MLLKSIRYLQRGHNAATAQRFCPTMEMTSSSIDAAGIQPSQSARIEVIGVGGGGSNAVNRMILSDLEGVAYRVVLNTDAQALIQSQAQQRLRAWTDPDPRTRRRRQPDHWPESSGRIEG